MENLQQLVEALIFASDTPLPRKKIKEVLELESEKEITATVKELNKKYQQTNSVLHIIDVAGGYQIVTLPEYDSVITILYRARAAGRLTMKALETLAIVAYKQPITKTEVEAIRGVNVDGVMRTLIERNLITVNGRVKAPGNPLLYGTTRYFLEYFGLKHIKDLPQLKEIDELLKGDDKFLEGLDQVALQEMYPEALGLTSMLATEDSAALNADAEESAEQDTPQAESDEDEGEQQAHDATE